MSDDSFPEEFDGLEESSQGVFDPGDDIAERPSLEQMGGLNLGAAAQASDESVQASQSSVLEVEHLFGQSPIFEGLDKQEIREIINRARKIPLQAGDPLFLQNDIADALFILQSGASPAGRARAS